MFFSFRHYRSLYVNHVLDKRQLTTTAAMAALFHRAEDGMRREHSSGCCVAGMEHADRIDLLLFGKQIVPLPR